MGNTTGGVASAIGQKVTIHGRQFRIQRPLGEGGFAYVFQVVDEASGKIYALKRILASDPETVAIAEQEILVMKTCANTKQIIQYKGHSSITHQKKHGQRAPTEYFILMEYCSGGTLASYIEGQKASSLSEKEVLSIGYDLCCAVAALHSQNPPICHRDIKLDNVLLAGDSSWRLCDFGSSTTRTKAYTTKEEICAEEDILNQFTTPSYRAPEMADLWQRKVIGPKADVWAVACVLYAVAFLKHPFQMSNGSLQTGCKVVYPKSHSYSEGFQMLLRAMFEANPDKRPDIGIAVNEILRLQSGGMGSKLKKLRKPSKVSKHAPKKESATSSSESEDHDNVASNSNRSSSPENINLPKSKASPSSPDLTLSVGSWVAFDKNQDSLLPAVQSVQPKDLLDLSQIFAMNTPQPQPTFSSLQQQQYPMPQGSLNGFQLSQQSFGQHVPLQSAFGMPTMGMPAQQQPVPSGYQMGYPSAQQMQYSQQSVQASYVQGVPPAHHLNGPSGQLYGFDGPQYNPLNGPSLAGSLPPLMNSGNSFMGNFEPAYANAQQNSLQQNPMQQHSLQQNPAQSLTAPEQSVLQQSKQSSSPARNWVPF